MLASTLFLLTSSVSLATQSDPPTPPQLVVQGGIVVTAAELVAAGKAVDQVVSELNRFRSTLWHDWYCQYADGTLVHNDFRFYRTSQDVWNYFVGHPNSHDCDATVTVNGRRVGKFCTTQAAAFARAHGGIVYVGRE